ncbi:MAG: HDIG domain-containing protein [Chloroflexi bacterium]|nr:HDIG domain-containing protein [Chloroflexota bacterium]
MKEKTRRFIFFALIVFVTASLSFIAALMPALAPFSPQRVSAGQVIAEDILAPRDITFESETLTAQQREAARRAVSPVYTATDTTVARRQLERLRSALAYIVSVRGDSFASPQQRVADLAALEDVHISQESAAAILALSESRWQVVQQEAIVVLEQVMRSTIREDRLEEARRSASALVTLSLTEEQAAVVAELASAFVAANSFYSEPLTLAAQDKASEAVEPVMRSLKAGETVALRGQILSETDMEALEELGLTQAQLTWQDLAAAAALVALSTAFLLLYLRRYPARMHRERGLSLVITLFLAFLFAARLTLPGQTLTPYLFPLAAFSLTLAALFGLEPALVTTLPLALLAAHGQPEALALTSYYIFTGYFSALALGRAQRVMAFFGAAAAVALSGAGVILVFRLPQPGADWAAILPPVTIALLNGIVSAGLAMLLQFFMAQFLGVTTALQLIEISRSDHPLLQYALRQAPGTYQHSLQVANLAEQAAERIGADALLTRVGALYHDVGKAKNPAMYIENQAPGSANPHEQLDPESSAAIIIRHVTDGVELARQHRIPRRIQDFILEHHGTLMARYQYVRAVKAAGGDESKVDVTAFTYPGPRPRSRETAILMLADGSEAHVRAERPSNETEMREIIRRAVQNRVDAGQLDLTNLTLRDLDTIVDSFATTLRGIYHPRIEYPQLEKPAAPAGDSPTIPSARQTTQGNP